MLKENPIYELSNNLSILLDNAPKGFSKEKIQAIINRLSAPLQVMIMGEFSVGKSTFINALLKQEVAITSPVPTTAVITKFVYGNKDRIIVHFWDGKQQEYSSQDFNRLTVENNGKYKEIHDRIEYVERQLPNELLKTYNFIDSPGRNAIVEKHEEVTRNFVENADAMLWLFSVDQMGGKTEKDILQSFSKRLKPIAIVNKVDLVDDDDELDELLEELKLNFKDDIADVVPISSECALKGILKQKKDLLDFSNFQQVYDELEQNIGSKYIYLKAKKSLQDLVFVLSEYSKIAYAAAKEPFAAEKENYVWYVNKLREAVKVIDITNKPLKNIMALLAKIIGKRELPESNEDYMAISKIINAWSCRNVIGAELYDALRGDVAAQFEYAKQVSGDAAEYWYNESGEGGYLPAQQVLYKNCIPAGYWYERAAQNGDKYAILNVAFSYYYGGDGVEKNMHKAAYWLKAAVKYEQSGVEKARYCLACLYKAGIAVDQDFEQAYILANLAAKANYIDAILLTAELIYNGQGVAQNKIKAFLILRENKRYFEIEKYFVNDNYDLHRTIAERFSSLNDDIDRPDVKYHSKYFWYKLDFEHNGNVDSAYICGELYMKKRVRAKQEKNLLEALRWFDICARRKNLAAMKKAGDICYFKLGKKRQAMKYYARGLLHGDGYCSGMLCKWLCSRGVVAYIVLSVVVHGIGVHIYDEDKVRKDNREFEIAKRYLDQMRSEYQNDKYANSDEISRVRNDIEVLKDISRKQKIYRYLDKYLLFSEYNPLRYSEVTDQYNDYYEDMLHSMEEKERLSSNGTARENRKENQQKISSSTQNNDMNLSQSDIKDAARLFCAYHEKLTDHNFDGAYAMLTDKRKSNLGSSSKLAEWYRNTLESTVTDITCKDIDGNEVIFNYELRARDKVKGPKILVQYYEGEVHLFKNKGQWRIGYAESKKVSERYE